MSWGASRRLLKIGGMFLLPAIMAALLLVRLAPRILTHRDTLAPADAIVVLDGEYPFRLLEAVDLYHAGKGREIWLARESERRRITTMFKNKSDYGQVSFNRIRSRHQPLPLAAMKIRPRQGQGTRDELESIVRLSRQWKVNRIILVTTDFHSRRVRLLADHIAPATLSVQVTWSHYQPVFGRPDWWRNQWYQRIILAEMAKLLLQWMDTDL